VKSIQISGTRFQSLFALLVMVVALSLLTESFLTVENLRNILRQISVNLCLSIGLTLVILSRGIDLSVGAVLALSGAAAAWLLKKGIGLPWFGMHMDVTVAGAVWAALIVGGLCGAVNGLTITKLLLPPFVATLAMLSMARGATLLWTGGFPITGLGSGLGHIGTSMLLGIPIPVWIAGLIVAASYVLTQHTAFGRHIIAVGGNERAARLAGLRVERIKLAVYIIAGILSGLAGLIVIARLDSAQPNAGIGYELDAIAAVVIGGTSLSGGRGSVTGTVLGCLIIGVLNNGLTLLDVSPFWQQVIKGLVIIVAVAMDRLGASRQNDAN
jgi:ribose transport system permease protein